MLLPLRSEKSPIASKRIKNIIDYLTFEVFRYSCRGLYENHKFLFTLLLPLKIGLRSGAIKHDELQTFIKGTVPLLGLSAVLKRCCAVIQCPVSSDGPPPSQAEQPWT